MYVIREDDLDKLRTLGSCLDMDMRFIEHYLETLQKLRSEWLEVE